LITLNNYINKIKEEINLNETELININENIEKLIKDQESINNEIKIISENISTICLDKKMDEYKPLIEKLETC